MLLGLQEKLPDAFTHETSEKRMNGLMRGFRSGEITTGNAFRNRKFNLKPESLNLESKY